ncbi:MAG TPA: nucleotide disphospho-sugar-binding domain-containing protein [Caulobacteraceae bacterium]|nr:nucleotide disphospho-sugar-binding domain-containing protein [Caulobacteraceae bacterium]
MRMLMATWDGAGNFPPERALLKTLTGRGHEVHVLGHDVQRQAVETDGGRFMPLAKAAQLDSGDPGHESRVFQEVMFAEAFGEDFAAAIDAVDPSVLLADCCLAGPLQAAALSRRPSVSMLHTLYSFIEATPFKAPNAAADLVLAFSYRGFDAAAHPPANVVYVGPLRAIAAGVAPWPRRFPDRPRVVVSLSTSFQGQQDLLQRLCNALAGLTVEAVVTTGRGIDPAALTAGENTTVARHVAHEAVLPESDLLISHAGHGTVMAGASCGAPLLCLPMGRDQSIVAAQVEALGIGRVADQHASPNDLRAEINAALADEEVKRAARAFARSVAGQTSAGRAADLVEQLALRA